MIKLSPYHEIFYNEWKLNPQRSDYNIVIDNDLWGSFDPERLNQALQRLSQDYFLLQSHVIETTEGCSWRAHPGLSIPLDYVQTQQTEAELLNYVKTPFNLETGPLLRARLIKLAEEHFRLIIVVHHLIMDGRKVGFIFDTVPRYYNDPTYRVDLNITEQCQKLRELSHRLENQLIINEANHTEFWRTQLTDLPGADLRFLKTSPHTLLNSEENSVGEYLFTLDADKLTQLQSAAKKYQITPFILSQIIFSTLLYRYTGQEKFGICFPFAINEGADFIYGVHVSPLVIPYEFSPSVSLKNLIEQTKTYFRLVKAGRHHYFPLQKLLLSFVSKDTVAVAFTQTNLKHQHFYFADITKEKNNTSLNIDLAGKLLFAQEIKDQQVFFRVLYKKEDIDIALLPGFVQTYQRLLPEMLTDLLSEQDNRPISGYSLLTPEQYQLLSTEWNRTDQPYPVEKTLHQLFEEQVLKTPNAIAIVYEGTSLTYAALNQQANQLAHYIKTQVHIQPDDLIALCVYPSHQMIVTLWAVLKTGAAYVPIDPAYPKKRIAYILKDTRTKLLLADQILCERLTPLCAARSITLLNINNQSAWVNYPATNPAHTANSRHLAYVIYTSGTTGRPKGVMIEHHSTVNYVTYLIQYNQLSSNSIGAKYVSFSFDGSVIEIFPILFSGGKLCVMKEADRLDCNTVNQFFDHHGITDAFLPTAFAELFCDLENNSLKNLMIGGAKLRKFVSRPYKIINVYGPTETTTQTTIFSPDKEYENIPIGKPIDNVQCYVVDTSFNLLPVGATGELMIGGAGVSRGYLNLPQLTERKFILNPFHTKDNKNSGGSNRLYKTGDLVRWLPDGNLEYTSRNDTQLKIRGYRIEPIEIENQLMRYPGIQQAVVVAADRLTPKITEQVLVAYYMADTTFSCADLRASLLHYLPEFMVPATYIRIPKFPVNNSGKLEKSLLPKPNFSINSNYVAPGISIEKTVCAIYAQILGLPEHQVGIHDDFFQLGGDSITAIRLTRQLSHYFTILVTDIFRLGTPANIIRELSPSPNHLHQKIAQIKQLYTNTITFPLKDWKCRTHNPHLIKEHEHYLTQLTQLTPDVINCKKIRSLVLTGATGHLGCHLLEKLLTETPYTIYLPIRATSDPAAYLRIQQKFQFYFDKDLTIYHSRIIAFAADLEKENLGLTVSQYQNLTDQADSVIHCASLVKYYGNYDEFYRSNVLTTTNLLAFTQLTTHPDFHYISTVGVLMDGYVPDKDYYIFTEDNSLTEFIPGKHPYIRSKYTAEQLVMDYQKKGMPASIYRVGNLAMDSRTYHIQEDFKKNFFFSHLQTMLQFGIVPAEISQVEVSPVDYTALAIVKLFDKANLSPQTYHLFNSHICNLTKILSEHEEIKISSDCFELFMEKILSFIDYNPITDNAAHLLMLYQFWLQEVDTIHTTTIRLSSEKTEFILAKLGFYWQTVTPEMFAEFINKSMLQINSSSYAKPS